MQPMTKRDLRTLAGIILTAVVIFVVFFLGVTYPRPTAPGEVVILPALPAQAGATPEDEIVALGYESHFTGVFAEDFMGAEPQTAISATASCVITPTGTYQPLESGGTVTCTLATEGALGRYTGVRDTTYTIGSLLWLVNEANTTIIVSEGTSAELSGATVSLGFSDTLTLFFEGTHWVELSTSNN